MPNTRVESNTILEDFPYLRNQNDMKYKPKDNVFYSNTNVQIVLRHELVMIVNSLGKLQIYSFANIFEKKTSTSSLKLIKELHDQGFLNMPLYSKDESSLIFKVSSRKMANVKIFGDFTMNCAVEDLNHPGCFICNEGFVLHNS